MFEFLSRVSWVSHANRVWVSSRKKPAECLAVFALFFLAILPVMGFARIASASDISVQAVIDLVNTERTKKGANELVINEKLSRAAMEKADNMIENNYFSHTAPDGKTPWHWIEKTGYDYSYAGENLAMDFNQAEKMHEAWMESPTHRANILNKKYKEIGVAVKTGIVDNHSTALVVQMFGSGDKNKSASTKKNSPDKVSSASVQARPEHEMPVLPAGKEQRERVVFIQKQIMFPKDGEVLNAKSIKITGRAKPGRIVALFDNGEAIGEAVSTEQGWFELELKDASQGRHRIEAIEESHSSVRNETNYSEDIVFYVERTGPQLYYRFYADQKTGNQYIKIISSKSGCDLKLGAEKRSLTRESVFRVNSQFSSVVASATDSAGNTTKRQISFANFYPGESKDSLVKVLAPSFFSREFFPADSGRRALVDNLGMAMVENNH